MYFKCKYSNVQCIRIDEIAQLAMNLAVERNAADCAVFQSIIYMMRNFLLCINPCNVIFMSADQLWVSISLQTVIYQ